LEFVWCCQAREGKTDDIGKLAINFETHTLTKIQDASREQEKIYVKRRSFISPYKGKSLVYSLSLLARREDVGVDLKVTDSFHVMTLWLSTASIRKWDKGPRDPMFAWEINIQDIVSPPSHS
jgi:hypothetical protein